LTLLAGLLWFAFFPPFEGPTKFSRRDVVCLGKKGAAIKRYIVLLSRREGADSSKKCSLARADVELTALQRGVELHELAFTIGSFQAVLICETPDDVALGLMLSDFAEWESEALLVSERISPKPGPQLVRDRKQ
jgi:uncharacterized protein with GYD domain